MSAREHRFEPTERLHERLARQLACDIVSGRLEEGAVVAPSEQLAETYGVSRTVAREALQALAADGLILVRHGKRTVVTGPDAWRFMGDLVKYAVGREQLSGDLAGDLFETRAILEVAAVRRCAERASNEHLEALLAFAERTLADYEAFDRDEPFVDRLVGDDLEFHRRVAEGSGNHVLTHMVTDVRRELVPTWALERLTLEELVEVARGHVDIARRLRDRDVAGVTTAMSEHLEWSVDTTLRRAIPHDQLSSLPHRHAR